MSENDIFAKIRIVQIRDRKTGKIIKEWIEEDEEDEEDEAFGMPIDMLEENDEK